MTIIWTENVYFTVMKLIGAIEYYNNIVLVNDDD
jgi:hypothetical protein